MFLYLGFRGTECSVHIEKNREMQTYQLVVNGFQFSTSISSIKNNFIFLNFPNDVTIYKENLEIKGKNIDPSGLSGAIIWSYESINTYPIGIVLEQNQQKIRCISIKTILQLIKEELSKEYNKEHTT